MSVRPRAIPCLLLDDGGLVKTVRFKAPVYVGDPANTVRIFNELEVDELCVLDIGATRRNSTPDLRTLEELASEAFMPLAVGGGIRSVQTARDLLRMGYEKVVLNTGAIEQPGLIERISGEFGAQAVIGSIDVRKKLFGRYEVVSTAAARPTGKNPVEWARALERSGCGELLLTSIDQEGTWRGYDLDLVHQVAAAVRIPVIANGGAGRVDHIRDALRVGASAVALGSMVVFQGEGLGVLVNFPDRDLLRDALLARR